MYNSYPSDGSKKICTVTAVDITRAVCKCIAEDGEILSDVRWVVPMGGSDGVGTSHHPVENSRVLVDFSTGFPFILGAILTESTTDIRRPNIGRQDVDEPQIADYTIIPAGDLIRGPGTPRDQRVGDIINTTDGGAIQGILSSGTVINKASPLAQVICSRFGDVVRIVSRNSEHFSDVDKEQKVSIRGSLYTRRDLYRSPGMSRSEVPNVIRYEGAVKAAEQIEEVAIAGYKDKDDVQHEYTYATIPVDKFPAVTADSITDKTYVYNDEVPAEGEPRVPVAITTLDIEGQTVEKIQLTDKLTFSDKVRSVLSRLFSFTTPDDYSKKYHDAIEAHTLVKKVDDSSISYAQQIASAHRKEVRTGLKTNWWMNETEFHWDVNEGKTFITGDANGVVINVEGAVVITCGADGNLTVTNSGNTSITTDGTLGVTAGDTTFSVGALTFDTSGDTTFNSGGNFTVSAPLISLN